MSAERLGVALLDLRTNDAGLTSGIRNAKAGSQALQTSFNETATSANLTASRIEHLTGVSGGLRRSAGDVQAYGQAMDDMRARFNPVYAAIRRYRQTVDEVRQAHAVGALTTNEMANAISRERQQALASIAALRGRAAAMDQVGRSTRYAAMQQRMLVFQMNDIFVSLASGMNPLMVFIQQGSQISQVYGPNEGGAGRALREMGDMVTRTVTRFPLLISAVAAGAVAFFGLTDAIRDSTKYSVTMGDVFVAAFQTIGSGILTIVQPALDVLGATWSEVWNWIVEGMRVTGNVLINGMRLIVLAMATPVRAIAEVFSLALATIVENWQRLPLIMGDLVLSAANRTIGGIEAMVNGAIDRINAMIEMLPDWIEMDGLGRVSLGRIPNPLEGFAQDFGQDLDALPAQISEKIARAIQQSSADAMDIIESDPMGDFYRGTRDRAIQRARDRANAEPDGTPRAQISPYRNLVLGARDFIAAQEIARRGMTLTEEAAAALRYEHELLNQAIRSGVKLTPAQREELSGLAREMASAEHATEAFRERIDFLREQTRSFVNDMREGLAQGQSFWEAFGSAVGRAISRIVDRSLDQLIDAIFRTRDAMASTGGGGGGGIGSAISRIFAGFFATGGLIPSGSFGIVGEAGPEPVIGTSQGAKVLPNSALRTLEGGRSRDTLVVTTDKSPYFNTIVERVATPVAAQAGHTAFQASEASASNRARQRARSLK